MLQRDLVLLVAGEKCSVLQCTAILRLPTPMKPPKSMTAACGWPLSSTSTSTSRPMSLPSESATRRPGSPRPDRLHGCTICLGRLLRTSRRRRRARAASRWVPGGAGAPVEFPGTSAVGADSAASRVSRDSGANRRTRWLRMGAPRNGAQPQGHGRRDQARKRAAPIKFCWAVRNRRVVPALNEASRMPTPISAMPTAW